MARTPETDRGAKMPVALRTHVEIELVDESGVAEALAFDIVTDGEADFARGLVGVGTPLAQALLGHISGEVVPYRVGDVVEVRVLRVAPMVAASSTDLTARRQTVVQQAVTRSEMLDDAAFALAAGSKWGRYDPLQPPADPDTAAPPGPRKPGRADGRTRVP